MNKINYDAAMVKIAAENKKAGVKPKLLLHSCCAPCSSACLERVKGDFEVTVFYYNPNIDGEEEYYKRAKEQERLCSALKISEVTAAFNKEEFYSAVKGLESEPEGGARCAVCFYLRLKKTAEKAKSEGYDYFSTTLTVSPLKNAETLNAIGQKVEKECGVKFLPSDFKKRGGYLRSIELSKVYGLYRQNYCGCEFSKNQIPNGI